MVFLGYEGMQQLLSSQFKLGAEAGVAGGPVGREAQASTDWKLKEQDSGVFAHQGAFCRYRLERRCRETR